MHFIINGNVKSAKNLIKILKNVLSLLFSIITFCAIFLKFFLKSESITTFNPIAHVQKQTFLKMILLKIMKIIIKNVILD